MDRLTKELADNISSRVLEHWRQMRAVEIVLEEISLEFDMDVLLPQARRVLAAMRDELLELHEGIGAHCPPVELAEPNEDGVDLIRGVIERAVQRACC